MTADNSTTEKRFGVALFGMPYLYQAGDFDFHMEMVKLGLRRGGCLLSGFQHKAILANNYEYWLDDYDDENELCRKFGFVPTYTVEDFVSEIKKRKGNEK